MERAFDQEIRQFAVPAPRVPLIKYLVFFWMCDLFTVVLLLFCLFLASGFPFVRPSADPPLVITVEIFMAVLSLLVLFLVVPCPLLHFSRRAG